MQNRTVLPAEDASQWSLLYKIRYTLDLTRQYHNLLQYRDESGEREMDFLWDETVLGISEQGENGYYLEEHLGSILSLTDVQGKLYV